MAPCGLVRLPGFAITIPGLDSSTSTQSALPSAWLPVGVSERVPALTNGEPAIDAKVPRAGSNQRATTGPLKRDMSTVMARTVGKYAMARLPSGVLAAVT